MFLGFYSFGDNGKLDGVGHVDDGLNDLNTVLGSMGALNEEAVDLEGIDIDVAKTAKRGIVNAEIVNGNADAKLAEVLAYGG